jgi:hypothetical protein
VGGIQEWHDIRLEWLRQRCLTVSRTTNHSFVLATNYTSPSQNELEVSLVLLHCPHIVLSHTPYCLSSCHPICYRRQLHLANGRLRGSVSRGWTGPRWAIGSVRSWTPLFVMITNHVIVCLGPPPSCSTFWTLPTPHDS